MFVQDIYMVKFSREPINTPFYHAFFIWCDINMLNGSFISKWNFCMATSVRLFQHITGLCKMPKTSKRKTLEKIATICTE